MKTNSSRSERPIGRHLKVQLAAWLLGKSTKWIKQMIADGKLDAYLLGHDIVVSEASINAYLDSCRITGAVKDIPSYEDDGGAE
jgi:hypothetical protein